MRPLIRRAVSLFLCLLFLPALASPASAAEAETPAVRVLLKRLGLTTRADLVLDGWYAITCGKTELALPRGSMVTVEMAEGSLYLFWEGLVLRAGGSVVFTRCAEEGGSRSGLRFSAAGNLYPGDLSLTIADGALSPVLTIGVEDYLLGVVPYEMSDSFPLEALKAQAVCARTYALSHRNPSRGWDLVDTAQDQVFRGVSSTAEASARAVEETRGVVGMYRSKLAQCYYSASNGGQTELARSVWSGHADCGDVMKDDPYDLENPASPVKRAALRADAEALPLAFREILYNYLYDEMRRLGYDAEPTSLRLLGLSGLALGRPAHSGSRRFTELTLTVRWSGRRWKLPSTPEPEEEELSLSPVSTPAPSPSPSPAPLTPAPTRYLGGFEGAEETALTLPLFPEVARALELSIYGADNELITLTETEVGWRLESRRFGHGVGMSQRGAEWMARHYGFGYEDILRFYYPSMTLAVSGTAERALPALPAIYRSTAAPAATAVPTPRPTLIPVSAENLPEGAYIASVEGVADGSSLNLRTEPNTACEIITRLYKHQSMIVLELLEDGVWAHVLVGPLEGYVMVEFLGAGE